MVPFHLQSPKALAAQGFTITPSAFTALGTPGQGFFVDNMVLDPIVTTYTVPTGASDVTNGGGTIAAITAVPEPSSFALLGLVACGYMILRRRAAKVS